MNQKLLSHPNLVKQIKHLHDSQDIWNTSKKRSPFKLRRMRLPVPTSRCPAVSRWVSPPLPARHTWNRPCQSLKTRRKALLSIWWVWLLISFLFFGSSAIDSLPLTSPPEWGLYSDRSWCNWMDLQSGFKRGKRGGTRGKYQYRRLFVASALRCGGAGGEMMILGWFGFPLWGKGGGCFFLKY